MDINKGTTNVKSLRMGRNALKGIGKDLGKYVVTTMDIPWKITSEKLGRDPLKVIMVESVDEKWLDAQLTDFPDCDCVMGIGGGQAVDAAKFFAWKKGVRLVTVPTILSVDAFVTPAAGIRRNHQVVYVGETSPDPLVVDFEVIRTAPPELNIAGIGDLLSMHTATWDWEFAEKQGKSEYPFSKADVNQARNMLGDLFALIPEVRSNSDRGLRAIIDAYMRMNTICLPAGHYRIEEGSEHYLFYELENRLQRPFIHGYIVGLGIYLMSQLQGNSFEEIREVMDEAGLRYHPVNLKITRRDMVGSLMNLRQFVLEKPELWYTVINDAEISVEWAEQAIADLIF